MRHRSIRGNGHSMVGTALLAAVFFSAPPAVGRVAPGPARVATPVVTLEGDFGGKVSGNQLLASDADGDGAVEIFVVRGGRLERHTADGAIRWRTAPLAALEVGGPVDVNGDGLEELLVTSTRTIHLVDADGGEVVWTADEAPFTRMGRILVDDFTGDGLPDIVAADRACGNGGRGPAVAYSFGDGFEGDRVVSEMREPREYICGIYHVLADLDGDGLAELIVPDQAAVHGFDPRTGARTFEGRDLGALPFGVIALRVTDIDADGDDELLGISDYEPSNGVAGRRGLTLLDVDDEGLLAPRWSVQFDPIDPVDARTTQLATFAGGTQVVTSRYEREAAAWRIERFAVEDGALRGVIEDARVLGLVGADRRSILARLGDTSAGGSRFGTLAALSPLGARLWTIEGARVLKRDVRIIDTERAARTDTLVRQRAADGSTRLLVELDTDADHVADSLLVVNEEDGSVVSSTRLAASIGAVSPPLLDAGSWAVSLAGGRVGLYDPALELQNPGEDGEPAVRAPAGAVRIGVTRRADGGSAHRLVSVGPDGDVRGLDPSLGSEWTRFVGGLGPEPVVAEVSPDADAVVVQDLNDPEEGAWIAFDAETGETLWRHARTRTLFRPLPPIVATDADGDGDPDFIRVDDLVGTRDLLLVALDGMTGDTIWELAIPGVAAGWPTRPSLADADGDGVPELYVGVATSTWTVDPIAGEVLRPGAFIGLSGGVVVNTGVEPPLLYLGGNGPIRGLDAALDVVWTAEEVGGGTEWLRRDAAILDGLAWTVPGFGRPLSAYDLADGSVDRAFFLAGGAQLEDAPPIAPNLAGFTRVPDLLGDGPDGVLLTGDDGYLYALTDGGGMGWSRAFGTRPGVPALLEIDGDDDYEIALPLADGRLVIVDDAGPIPPEAVWDNDGEALAGNEAADIDETTRLDRLGADWPLVENAQGYEARALGEEGIVVAGWTPVDGPVVRFDDLELVPGSRYWVEVRSRRLEDNVLQVSESTFSDGVTATDETPPDARLELSAEGLELGSDPLGVTLVAADDDRIRRWDVQVVQMNAQIRALGSAVEVVRDLEKSLEWDGRDDAGMFAPPGAYTVRATVEDRFGNTTVVDETVRICGGDEKIRNRQCRRPYSGPWGDLPDACDQCDCAVQPDGTPSPGNALWLLLLFGTRMGIRRRRRA